MYYLNNKLNDSIKYFFISGASTTWVKQCSFYFNFCFYWSAIFLRVLASFNSLIKYMYK